MKNGFEGKPESGMLLSSPCHNKPVKAQVVASWRCIAWIPDGKTFFAIRNPLAHMVEAQRRVSRSNGVGLPLIIQEERILVILEVLHLRIVGLRKAGDARHREIGQGLPEVL